MKAVENDQDFLLKFPVDADAGSSKIKYSRTVKAKTLWNFLVEKATICAEPRFANVG